MSDGWGGRRSNAGSGGKRQGAGRPRVWFNSRGAGATWIVENQQPGKFPDKPRAWRVLSVADDEIEFQDIDTEEIIVIRLPDDVDQSE